MLALNDKDLSGRRAFAASAATERRSTRHGSGGWGSPCEPVEEQPRSQRLQTALKWEITSHPATTSEQRAGGGMRNGGSKGTCLVQPWQLLSTTLAPSPKRAPRSRSASLRR